MKLQPYRQHSVALRKEEKKSLRYFGPFEIFEKIGKVAYKLLLLDFAKIYPVSHISLLKKFQGHPKQQYFLLHLSVNELGLVRLPNKNLVVPVIKRNGKEISEVLVQGDSRYDAGNSWDELDEMKRAYLHINLEDKVVFKGESNIICTNEGIMVGREFVEKEERT